MTDNPDSELAATTHFGAEREDVSKTLTGEALVKKAGRLLRAEAKGKYDSAIPDALAEQIHGWVDAGVEGAPILKFSPDYDHPGDVVLNDGGYLNRPLELQRRTQYSGWQLAGVVIASSGRDTWDRTIDVSLHNLLHKYDNSRPPLLVVGEEAARERLQQCRRPFTDAQFPTTEVVQRDARLLETMVRAQLSVDLLGLTDEERFEACERHMELALTHQQPHIQMCALESVSFLVGMESREVEVLIDAMHDQLAGMLPVLPSERDATPIGVARGLAHFYKPDDIAPADFVPNSNVQLAGYLSWLYARRQEQLATSQPGAPADQLPVLESSGDLPSERDLFVFTIDYPNTSQAYADAVYLLELQAAGYPIYYAVRRDEERMVRGTSALLQAAFNMNDPSMQVQTMQALEYLHDLRTPEHREEFYRLIGERFATQMPFNSQAVIHRHVAMARVMGRLMPNPPTGPDGQPLNGDVRTAAIMSYLYKRRAMQLLASQIRRYIPLEEDAEEITSSEAL